MKNAVFALLLCCSGSAVCQSSAPVAPAAPAQRTSPALTMSPGTLVVRSDLPRLELLPVKSSAAAPRPVPAQWPDLKLQDIPTRWPKFNLLPVERGSPPVSPPGNTVILR
jgi:hypothetical protein